MKTIDLFTVQPREAGHTAIPDALMFPIERIVPQKDQPRSEFEEDKLRQLTESIRSRQGSRVGGSGLIHPLAVRWEPGATRSDGTIREDARVIITAGESRYQAAKRAGLTHVPVIVSDMNADEAYEDALTENLVRGDLSPTDEGRAFLYLKNKYKLTNLQVAQRIYEDASRLGYVQSRIQMMGLNAIVEPLISKRADSLTACRRIMAVKDPKKQRELVDYMMDGGTFAELNSRVQKIRGIVPRSAEERQASKRLQEGFPSRTTSITEGGVSEGPVAQVSNEPGPTLPDSFSADKGCSGVAGVASDSEPASSGAEKEENSIFGSPRPAGIKTGPAFHIGDALESLGDQMDRVHSGLQGMRLPAATRRKYLLHVARLRHNLEGIEAVLAVK